MTNCHENDLMSYYTSMISISELHILLSCQHKAAKANQDGHISAFSTSWASQCLLKSKKNTQLSYLVDFHSYCLTVNIIALDISKVFDRV